jgi:peroxiredoxin Q/BCP
MTGKKAPNFKTEDVLGDSVELYKQDEGYTLLVFLRYSGCPWCNLAIHRLALEYGELKREGCDVIAFIQSESKGVMENIYDRHELKPKFPIIADHGMKIYKKYGVDLSITSPLTLITHIPHWLNDIRKLGFNQKKIDGNFFLVPAWYLVNNATHKIIKSGKASNFYDHEAFIDIYDSLTFG